MARTIISISHPILKIADTQAGLTSGTAWECQLTLAEIIPTPQTTTVPATGCAPAVDVPGLTKYTLHVEYLQDWTASAGGLSQYSLLNDGKLVWFSFAIDSVGFPTTVATGQAYVSPGSYGGQFGDGSAADSTADWNMPNKPTVTVPALLMADEATADATA